MNVLAYDRTPGGISNVVYRLSYRQTQPQIEINDEISNNRQGRQLDANEYILSN